MAATSSEVSGLGGANIFGANVVEKAAEGTLMGLPTEAFGLSTLFAFL
jgi:hypothetical protein